MKFVLTCEHATNAIPEVYQHLFREKEEVLESHRGYDPGAYELFKELSPLSDFSDYCTIGRLLVEVNRSQGHPSLFSEFTKKLSQKEKINLLKKYYFPFRNSVDKKIAEYIQVGEEVVHLSVHTFSPELKGQSRNTDFGLLYDPDREQEKRLCRELKIEIARELPKKKVRFNYPYLGKADGFTTFLRKKYPKNYLGIELEVNQKWVKNNKLEAEIKAAIFRVLKQVLEERQKES